MSPTLMSQDKPWPRMPSLSAGRLFTLPAAAQGRAAHSSLPGHPLSPVTMAAEWFLPNILQPCPLPHPCIHCKASWLLSGLCRGCSLTHPVSLLFGLACTLQSVSTCGPPGTPRQLGETHRDHALGFKWELYKGESFCEGTLSNLWSKPDSNPGMESDCQAPCRGPTHLIGGKKIVEICWQ